MDVRCMASLLMPVANCAELLVKESVQPLLGRCMEVATTHIRQMDDNTVKSKEMVAISDLLAAIKMLCHRHEYFFDCLSTKSFCHLWLEYSGNQFQLNHRSRTRKHCHWVTFPALFVCQ